MPELSIPCIAINFETFATQVAIVTRDRNDLITIDTRRFYNVFETNPISRRETPRIDVESIRNLAQTSPERALSLSRRSLLNGESIVLANGERYDTDFLLVELFESIKSECEKQVKGNVRNCVLTFPSHVPLYDRLRRAAIGASFENVVFSDRGICAAYQWALENQPNVKRILLVNVGYDSTEFYVLKPRRDGVEESSEHIRDEYESLGLSHVLVKLADKVLKSLESKIGAEKTQGLCQFKSALLVEIDVLLRKLLVDPTTESNSKVEIQFCGHKLRFPISTISEALRKNNSQIVHSVVESARNVMKANSKIRNDNVLILVAGDGATAGLVDKLQKAFKNVSRVSPNETIPQNSVSYLTNLPLPHTPETTDERNYVAIYNRAVGGDYTAFLPLAKILLRGQGVSKRYDEGFYWLQKADALDDPQASALLAECYRKGRGTAQDSQKAREARERAQDLEDAHSSQYSSPMDRIDKNDYNEPSPSEDSASRSSESKTTQSESKKTSQKQKSTRPIRAPQKTKTRFAAPPRRVLENIVAFTISSVIFLYGGINVYQKHAQFGTIPNGIALGLFAVSAILALIAIVTYYAKRTVVENDRTTPN